MDNYLEKIRELEEENKKLKETQVSLGEINNNYLMLYYLTKSINECKTSRDIWEVYLQNLGSYGLNYRDIFVIITDDKGEFKRKLFLKEDVVIAENVEKEKMEGYIIEAAEKRFPSTSAENTSIAMPVSTISGELMAVLVVGKEFGITFEDVELLEVYIQQSTAAIENITLNENISSYRVMLGDRLNQFVMLHYLTKEVHDSRDYKSLLYNFIKGISSPEGLGYKRAVLYINGDVVVKVEMDENEEISLTKIKSIDKNYVAKAMISGKITNGENSNVVVIPLTSYDEVIAVAEVEKSVPVNDEDIQLLDIFAIETANAITKTKITEHLEEIIEKRTAELKKAYDYVNEINLSLERKVTERTNELNETIKKLNEHAEELNQAKEKLEEDLKRRKELENELQVYATMDALTGVLNRRTGLQILENYMRLSDRTLTQLSLFYIDVDGLKSVNDTLGHKTGDELIKNVTEIIKRTMRKSDVICRIGGDEFIVVLPQCDSEFAKDVWERITAHIKEFNSGGRPYTLSLSHGFAEYLPNIDITVEKFVEEADKKMYLEKMKKKNKG